MHLKWKLLSTYRNEIMGVAIIYIVLFHYYEIFNDLNIPYYSIQNIVNILGTNGNIGVEIFLILSGLGCFFSFYKKPDKKIFYKKRCLRVLVPYTLIGLPYWIMYSLVFHEGTALDVFLNFTGISFFINQTATFWYIPFIMIMYFVFPIFYHYIGSKDSFRRFLFLEVGFITCTFILSIIVPNFSNDISIMTTRIVSFISGMFIGVCIKKDKTIPIVIYTVCSISLVLFFFDIEYSSYLIYRYVSFIQAMGIIFIVVTLLPCLLLRWGKSFLALVGKYSLEIYLLHIAFRRIMINFGLLTDYPEQYLIVVGLTIVFSFFVKKLSNLINKKIFI